jgi:putative hydrolase of the HAD superfamily
MKTLMFDLSEVLICGLIGIEKDLSQILNIPNDTILPQFGGNILVDLCRGEITEDEYLSQVMGASGWAIPKNLLKEIIRKNFHHQVEGMISLLKSLSKQFPLVLVSDHAREWIEYIEKIHTFLSLFQRKVYSFDTGMVKNDPAYFPSILITLQCKGEDCIFIDDNPRNVEQARLVGIHAILFQGRSKLESDFIRIGVKINRGAKC